MSEQILISNGINAYASGHWDEAETLFRQALDMNPVAHSALYFLGVIAMSKGILDEATQLLYKATLIEPKNKDYQYSLAVALQESGKTNEAIARYENIADMAESQNNLGNIYKSLGEPEKAREAFDKALEINPNMTWAYVNKAILERQENHSDKAMALLEKSLSIDPDFPQALYQLSVQNRLNKDVNNSLQYIEKSIKINNSIDFLWVEYGKVLKALNRPNEALRAFEKAIELNRFSTDSYFEKALILETSLPNEAEQAYRDVIRIDPSHIGAFNNLGALLYRENRIMEALEMYRQVFIINPNDATTAFNLAIALEDTGDFEEAAGLYFKILGQKQLAQEVHVRLANLLPAWFLKEPQKAKTYAEGWVKNFSDNPLSLHTLNALTGAADSTDTDFAYTQSFYNAFADSYEDKMKLLNCQIPDLIAKEVGEEHFKNVLDLGCGTGSCGAFLRKVAKQLIGVDASQKMIEKAQEKGVYNSVFTQDIADFLNTSKERFDLIVAADVFCYINELKYIIKEVHNHLQTKGQFIFTVEKAESDNEVRLQSNGRYQHGLSVIENILQEVGFETFKHSEVTLREENGVPCIGYLFSCSK